MGKKFLSAVLCAALLISASSTALLSASADSAADYGLADKTSDGVILHAFDWSYNTIKENLPAIAQAGYTSVQTSPVQAPKDYGSWLDTNGQWWKLYQPLGFSIATENSWLGTKAELTELCSEADKYGIKIICDIVSNHLAKGDGKNELFSAVNNYEPDIFADQQKYVHQLGKNVNDNRVQNVVQGKLSGLPDINTSEELVQNRVISLLEECIDCGVDGFRFDAAKHIETPDDGEFGSQFWPNVVNTASEYAKGKGVELYCYGEILNAAGTGRDTNSYTKYLDITDNKTGDITLAQIVNKNAANVVKAQAYQSNDKQSSPSNYVLWAESHDTYMGDSGSGGISNTRVVSNENIAKAWAIVASRSESKALYLARPGVFMGQVGDTAWQSTAVSEINKFHNKFIGVSDKVYNDGDVVAVQRGDSGIVLVNLGESSNLNVATQGMKDGTYKDAVTGNTFTVKGGKISGTVGSTGIAVVYSDAVTTLKANFSVSNGTSFKTDTMALTITLENAKTGTYSINGAAPVSFSGSVDLTIGEGVAEGSQITVSVTASDGSKEVNVSQTYTKEKVDHTGVFVYFDNSPYKWKDVLAFVFYDEKDSQGNILNTTLNAAWPGLPMDIDPATGYYKYEVPSNLKVGQANVIFSNGWGDQSSDLPITSNSMIFRDRRFSDFDPNGVKLVYGDMDNDGTITSGDALSILRAAVGLEQYDEAQTIQADVDEDKEITSADSLDVLRVSVQLPTTFKTGKEFTYTGTVTDDKPKNTFYIVDKAKWLFKDGCKLWIVNNDTKEALETIKESPMDDNSTYCFVDELPSSWKNVSVYRTAYNKDISEPYNTWNCGEVESGKNAIVIKSDKNFSYDNFEPKN